MNPVTKARCDLFGLADILAIRPDHKPLPIKITSGSHFTRGSLAEPIMATPEPGKSPLRNRPVHWGEIDSAAGFHGGIDGITDDNFWGYPRPA